MPLLKIEMIKITVSEDKAEKSLLAAEEKWGFHLTGGSNFSMPIIIFEVLEGTLAEQGGIRCGDCLLKINGKSLDNVTLETARKMLANAGEKVVLTVAASEGEDTITISKYVHEVQLSTGRTERGSIDEHTTQFLVRHWPVPPKQPWHPVMWPQLRDDEEAQEFEAKPHARIIKNVKRFFGTCHDPEERQKILERMLMSLPTATKLKDFDPEEEEEERRKLAELRRLSLQLRGELPEE